VGAFAAGVARFPGAAVTAAPGSTHGVRVDLPGLAAAVGGAAAAAALPTWWTVELRACDTATEYVTAGQTCRALLLQCVAGEYLVGRPSPLIRCSEREIALKARNMAVTLQALHANHAVQPIKLRWMAAWGCKMKERETERGTLDYI
jgi:hypothetical protein